MLEWNNYSALSSLIKIWIIILIMFVFYSGPAPENITNKIFSYSEKITEYKICRGIEVDLGQIKTTDFQVDGKTFTVEVSPWIWMCYDVIIKFDF